MLEYRTVPFVIGAVFLVALAVASEDPSIQRSKRQAPNINVHQIPKTSFSCNDKKIGEYYADPEANCQVYHVCIPGMHSRMSLISFVCPNGTIFSQATRVCTPYDRVDCSLALQFYESLHGNPNNKRTDYEADTDYENYVPQPQPQPRAPATPPRQPQPVVRSRNTPATPPPQEIQTPAPRNTRFRSNQFRGQQAPPVTTPAPARQITTQATRAPARPALPSFRPPVVPPRPAQIAAVVPPRPTARAVVSTSTANYNYEYEYEYDYEDDGTTTNDQANARSKREVLEDADDYYDTRGLNLERTPQKTSFTCQDKVAGGVYADMETDCEMFHICVPLGKYKMLDYKVYCANGTAFDQETGSCKVREEFICENAQLFYQLDKPSQPTSGKKPVYKKNKNLKLKKATFTNKE